MAKIKSTNGDYPVPTPKTRWVGIFFFIIIHLVAVVGTPLYAVHYGISAADAWLFAFFFVCTSMAITAGYHRQFAHVTYKANPVLRFLLLFFGAATFEQSALKWASQHRQHHQFTDTDRDPYNINNGFWYAHMNWILLWKHRVNYANVGDLQRSKLVMHQHHWYSLWSVGAGMALPMAIGFAIGRPWGAFVLALCLRLVLVMHSAFFINSYAHMIGKKNFDGSLSARDHWLGAILTNGEGYHNFHHKFPNDYRNGVKWYHWDPTKWFVFVLSKAGVTWDLKRTPRETILAAEESYLISQAG